MHVDRVLRGVARRLPKGGPVAVLKSLTVAAVLGAMPLASLADEVIRHTGDPGFPIARAVEVPAGMTTVYLSGMVPAPANADADPATPEAWGDTRTQTISVLDQIAAALKDLDLTMGDVVKMQAFLVAPKGGSADFAGFMEGYSQFFGTQDQPHLPVRSTVIVDALVHPQWLVEIEVTAVRAN